VARVPVAARVLGDPGLSEATDALLDDALDTDHLVVRAALGLAIEV
jgi:hypothetical protein